MFPYDNVFLEPINILQLHSHRIKAKANMYAYIIYWIGVHVTHLQELRNRSDMIACNFASCKSETNENNLNNFLTIARLSDFSIARHFLWPYHI